MIIGRLGADPEVRYTQSNVAVATLSVATTERFKNKNGEQVENTEWHRLTAWGRLAEICQEYLKKGSLAYFEGPIQTKEWTDKENVKRYTTEIKVLSMQMLDTKDNSNNRPSAPAHGSPSKPSTQNDAVLDSNFDDMDDDLPF